MLKTIILHSYELCINGLSVHYTFGNQTTSRTYDPKATCDLLQQHRLIEGWDIDQNGEPVILYTQDNCGRPVTGWALWYLFAKHFPLKQREVEIIMEMVEGKRMHLRTIAAINRLLAPLKTAC